MKIKRSRRLWTALISATFLAGIGYVISPILAPLSALLGAIVALLVGRRAPRTVTMTTPYEVGGVPHDYHPTPSFRRDNYVNLNGEWHLSVLWGSKTVYEGPVIVPFAPESLLSGVERITKPGECLVYRRSFSHEEAGSRQLLHFGAVDNEARVYVNGREAGRHVGGYLPFTLDITSLVTPGENTLEVRVRDDLDHTYPYGKQRHARGGMWYTPVSGIWQTVWLEQVPEVYIRSLRIDTTLDQVTVTVKGGAEDKVLTLMGEEHPFRGETVTLPIKEPRLWTPEAPHLYEFTVRAGEDEVASYFALRTVGVTEGEGQVRMTLNGKPYFFHGLLDQGYYPDGIYTPASAEGFREDILRMKSLGFNMLRKHIKIEPDIFYYYCDFYGMAVFQDMVNNGRYRFLYDTAMPTIGFKALPRTERRAVREAFFEAAEDTVARLYNHPSVVYYTIFNEGWGQHDSRAAYERLRPQDPSRLWDTASGWFGKGPSDVQSEHVYFKRADFAFDKTRPAVLSEFGGYSCNVPGHVFNLDKVYGYKRCPTQEALTHDLAALYREQIVPLVERGLSAAVYTQVSDVEDETNGLLTYDRRIVKPDADVMRELAELLRK